MANSALLPRTAPFGDDDIASLDRVLSGASPVQRAWLAGFLAGLDAQAGTGVAPQPAAPPKAAEPLTILFASESGNSERLALDTAKIARKSGFKPSVVDFADLDLATLPKAKRLIVIAATWGEGEPPARATRGYNELMSDAAPKLDGVEFGVLALGDTAYVDFCGLGKNIDARLEALGAKRMVDRVDCDLDFDTPAANWIKGALKSLAPPEAPAPDNVVALDFGARGAGEISRDPVAAEIVEHINLSSARSDKEVIHVALGFEDSAPPYEPGDAIEVFPENDPELVEAVLTSAGLAADDTLRRALATERDITTLPANIVEKFVAATGHAGAKKLVDEGAVRAWAEGRQLIDLLEEFPATLSAEQLTSLTRPLPPRAYSIASSRKEVGEEAHILVAATRYQTHGRARKGVASTYIADRLKSGASVKTRIKQNKHFRLPDPATDIIMVGPGTGVAPFRAFVQERRAIGATGRNWLFFGDRRFLYDFTYQLEWQDALADGSLSRIDLAFSRDTPEKVYVQDKIWDRRRDLIEWLDNGARFYVCGDATHMAKDVRATLQRALADVKGLSPEAAADAVNALERDKRYLQDVY
ncbi:MAG TPA: flavodoxin domain-containing protein [Enterovirga sp.]|nr:flavodoxin domain-containing protein [Enterovirga sp.]